MKTYSLVFQFTEESRENLSRLAERAGVDEEKLVSRALALMDTAVKYLDMGYQVGVYNEGEFTPITNIIKNANKE
jgi:hypothetical protein